MVQTPSHAPAALAARALFVCLVVCGCAWLLPSCASQKGGAAGGKGAASTSAKRPAAAAATADATAEPRALNPARAAVSSDRVWTRLGADQATDVLRESVDNANRRPDGGPPDPRRVAKAHGMVFMLDTTRLDNVLRPLPPASVRLNDAGRPLAPEPPQPREQTDITLPAGDGNFIRFRVRRSDIFMPGAKKPEGFESFVGQGIDNPAYTTRFDRTPSGVHAIIIGPGGTFYVDPAPAAAGRAAAAGPAGPAAPAGLPHVGYRTRDRALPEGFRCVLTTQDAAAAARPLLRAVPPTLTGGQTLRTYRLAMAATGEYSKFFRDARQDPFQAVSTTVNRVIAIYESELAVTFVLVANEADLIHEDASRDPYTNDNANRLLGENQSELDKVVKDGNYDVGHVLGTGGGGLAALRSVCVRGNKARGETGSSQPRGDGFDVDYVAHELGHQFGGNHTFNGAGGSCAGNRNADTAYEPGSGSTIMAYAGICAATENLQDHSDAYFHVANLAEMVDFINNGAGNTVGGTPTNNPPPTVAIEQPKNAIPKATPFELSARGPLPAGAQGLTYCWEECDLGPAAEPGDDSNHAVPLFRSYAPTTSPTRTFPRMRQLLDPTARVEEWLPTRGRTLTFRVTARALYGNLGTFAVAGCDVPVAPKAGPFKITAPAAAAAWKRGMPQTVRWDVAATNVAPVNCKNVNIALTTDNGQTWIPLANKVPNNGDAAVVVPGTVSNTTAARLRVSSADNIFFDVSDENITIGD